MTQLMQPNQQTTQASIEGGWLPGQARVPIVDLGSVLVNDAPLLTVGLLGRRRRLVMVCRSATVHFKWLRHSYRENLVTVALTMRSDWLRILTRRDGREAEGS